MERALALAGKGWATTSPNPMVGAVVINAAGQCVGEGWHYRAGEPHAEVLALQAAGEQARDATVYVTLEPCCHTGRTGPCTEVLLQAGVKRVVVAVRDPNPQVAGAGIQRLQAQGVTVSVGCLQTQAVRLNRMFLWNMSQQRPWVTVKAALTLDGRMATRAGHSQWITSEAARADVHDQRAGYDAVLTSAATVRTDDPLLTVRSTRWQRVTPSLRLVLDRQGKLLLTPTTPYRVLDTALAPTCLIYDELAAPLADQNLQRAEQLGCSLLAVPWHTQGVDWPELWARLYHQMGVTRIWVEGGPLLTGHLMASHSAQDVRLYYAAKWLGDSAALGWHHPNNMVWHIPRLPALCQVTTTVLDSADWVVGGNTPATAEWLSGLENG